MLRLTELKLPLDHDEAALTALIVKTLGITPAELAGHHIHKRSYDARKQKLLLVYIAHVTLSNPALEEQLIALFAGHPHIGRAPDLAYYPPTQASLAKEAPAIRPVVIGFGPCGLFAALMLVALLLALQLDFAAVELALVAAALMVSYPLCKRFVPAPQVYLGMAFGWGVPMAFVATTGTPLAMASRSEPAMHSSSPGRPVRCNSR